MAKIKQSLYELKEGSKLFGEIISTIINSLLLTFVYFLGFGLTSIVAKVFGKDFIDENAIKDSYWEELNLTTRPLNEYYRQF